MYVTINKEIFKVKVCETQSDVEKGMMGRDFDSNFNGMLFLMDKGPHGFWMKDCIIPLDIIFIDGNTITKIHHSCPPCKSEDCPSYVGTGDTILELKGGTCRELSIKEGDKILF